jgi:hypothetical protein
MADDVDMRLGVVIYCFRGFRAPLSTSSAASGAGVDRPHMRPRRERHTVRCGRYACTARTAPTGTAAAVTRTRAFAVRLQTGRRGVVEAAEVLVSGG